MAPLDRSEVLDDLRRLAARRRDRRSGRDMTAILAITTVASIGVCWALGLRILPGSRYRDDPPSALGYVWLLVLVPVAVAYSFFFSRGRRDEDPAFMDAQALLRALRLPLDE
jgi:hypothetical protein